MATFEHQQMGYDRAITLFSPDGRLLQVEYAKKTVNQGSTAIGIVFKDGVVLMSDKRVSDKLTVLESIEKIFPIDDHIITAASGILSDARVLIERAQQEAQQHKVTFDTPIDVLSIVKDMGSLSQICTQSGGLRPFGVGLLVAGINHEKSVLYETDPVGLYIQYYATAIGKGSEEMKTILEKKYKRDFTFEQAVKTGYETMKEVLKDGFDINKIDCVAVFQKELKNKSFSTEELKKIIQK